MAPLDQRPKVRNAKSKRSFSNNVPPGLHYLPPRDPKSKEFLELFRSFLTSKDELKTILALSGDDAKLFIEIIDRAFRAARLDNELRKTAFGVLRKLCGKIGHLPDSYLLSDKFDLTGMPLASGGFADVRKGSFKGKDVAVKSLRVSEMDDKMKIRKRFCKEVAMWKNLSHQNVLNLIGVPDTLEDGRFSMVSDWMAHGHIMDYVRRTGGNHLKLLADAVEGLGYLHNACIVHGDLKGANILITNTNPPSACLADFGFMTIVHDLEMESTKTEVGGGTTPFRAPELLVPSEFGLEKCTPTKEADIYATAMVIYQVLTGTVPFGRKTGPEVVFQVLEGVRPSKPTNAQKLGLSGQVWKLLEDGWQQARELRPSVKDVLSRLRLAASTCGRLAPLGGVAKRQEEPDSDFSKFDKLFLGMVPDDEGCPIERLSSQESVTSVPDSLFSKLSGSSEAESPITEPGWTSPDALAKGNHLKGESMEDLPASFFSQASDPVPHPRAPADPVSRSSTPSSESTARPKFLRENSGPYRNNAFAESSSSGRTLLVSIAPHQPRADIGSTTSTAVSHGRESHIEKQSVAELLASSYHVISDATAIPMPQIPQTRDNPMRQLRRHASTLSLRGAKSRPAEPEVPPQLNDNTKHKHWQSPFHIRQRISRVLDPNLHQPNTQT